MKRLLSLVAITVFLVALAIGHNNGTLLACGPGCFIKAEHSQATAAESLETVHLKVNGMTCSACVDRINTELAKLSEVKSSEINWEKGTADVHVTKGSNHKALEKAVKKAGLKVSSIECECKG